MAGEVDPTHSDRDPNPHRYRDSHPHGVGHCYLNADASGYRIRQAARQRQAIGTFYKKTATSLLGEESGKSEVDHHI